VARRHGKPGTFILPLTESVNDLPPASVYTVAMETKHAPLFMKESWSLGLVVFSLLYAAAVILLLH
jgi:hypothetical protein